MKRTAVWILSIVFLLTTVFVGAIITSLKLDYNFEKFFPVDDDETQAYKEHRLQFGSDNDFILVGIVNRSGVFNTAFLDRLDSLTAELGRLPYIDSVGSPINLVTPYKESGGFSAKLHFEPLLHRYSKDSLRTDSIGIMQNERFKGSFFSDRLPAVSMFLKTDDYLSKSACDQLADTLPRVLDKYGFDEYHLAGRSVGQSYYIRLMQSDLLIFVSASMLLLMIFLAIAYRSVWGVLVPMLVVLLSNVWILGFMALIGEPVNMILTVLPTIIFVVGMSDVVHIVSKYLEELRSGNTKTEALRTAFREVGMATLLTSVTTAIGFITLLTSAVEPIRIFGLYTALGVMVAYVLAFTVLPSVLVLMREPVISRRPLKDMWQRLLRKSFLVVIRNPITIISVSAVVILVSLFFTLKIERNNYLLEDLREGNEMKQHFTFFEKNFAGVRPFEMNVSVTDTSITVLDYEVVREMDKLNNYLIHEYEVGSMVSPLTLIKILNMADWGGMVDHYEVPSESEYGSIQSAMRILIDKHKRSLLDSTKLKWRNEFVATYIDTGLTSCRFTGRVGDKGSKTFAELNKKLNQYYLAEIDSGLIQYQLTGTAHLIDKNNAKLAGNMALGLLIAFALVALIMGLLFRSFKMVLVSLIPNMLPLLVIAGIVGGTGVELKVSVSIIFTIAFGIAVDDTIHFMSKIKLERLKGRSTVYALKRAYLSTGRAIILTTLMLCSGFLMLVFSDFLGTFYIGYLISITLFTALIADLFLLPALLLLAEKRKKG